MLEMSETLPRHLAIIMDGNGRWGKKKQKNRAYGHNAGIANIKKFLIFFLKKKIKNLTLYALSADNLNKRNHLFTSDDNLNSLCN